MGAFILVGLVGLAAGFLGGLLGVGGGVIMVPAFLYFLGNQIRDMKMASGTSMAVIIVVGVAASIQNARAGRINWSIVPIVAAFAIPGAWVGAWVMGHVASTNLKRIFALFLIAVAIKMLWPEKGAPTPEAAAGPEAHASLEEAEPEQTILSLRPPAAVVLAEH